MGKQIDMVKPSAMKIISNRATRLYEAIRREDWATAAVVDAYIKGAEQILLIFENAVSMDAAEIAARKSRRKVGKGEVSE